MKSGPFFFLKAIRYIRYEQLLSSCVGRCFENYNVFIIIYSIVCICIKHITSFVGQGSSPLLCIPAAFNESWKCYLAVNEVSVLEVIYFKRDTAGRV